MWNQLRLRDGATPLARTVFAVGLAVMAVAMLARSAFAQDTVDPFDLTGTVVDERGQPLVGAFVSLSGSDWGSLTNEQGRFRIPDLYPGRVELTAEQLGYATLQWTGEVTEQMGPLVLRMEAQAVVLEGLTVVTDRFRSRRNATATTVRAFDRERLATSPQPTVIDFVQAELGLTSTPCPSYFHSSYCVYSRGRPVAPSVYIDEMPVIGGMDYLASFRPHDLYMVEVYARGRHIRAYTPQFMERAAKQRLRPIALLF
ncbi:MAG TPA: carboxypeptidase regulatory-like domain-containing protein [Longimicrobiales bacterium]|nr:carboxypeptidase regulatory-like domain-containing protein [Longimicrobiales bacterium]